MFRDFAYKAAPNAPMRPAMGGLVTSFSVSISKLRKIASLRKVPPCTTYYRPAHRGRKRGLPCIMHFYDADCQTGRNIEISAPSFVPV